MEITPTFAGIDWSWRHHALCVLDEEGRRIEEAMVPHSKSGLAKVTTLLTRHGVRRVGIERGDGPVVEHLLRDGFEVVVISARQVKSLRARYGSAGNKDDRLDAFVLADALRTDAGRWAIVRPDQPDTVALRMLVRARQANWLKANGYCGRHTPQQLVDHLHDAATGRVNGAAAEAGELIVLALVDLLSSLRIQTAALEVRIKEALLAHPDGPIFTSLPRAGAVRAATLLAEIGDCRARFPDPAALAAAAGVAPSTRQSGKHLNVAYRRGCNKHLRNALIDWAQDTPRANPWAEDTYRRARNRGCRHPHAARILAQAWTRILWRCWHDHQPYNPDLHGRLHNLTREVA